MGPPIVVLSALLAAADLPASLRYDLRPGDRLSYRERLERAVSSKDTAFATEAEWTSQVVITGTEPGGGVALGFQRNRGRTTLLRYAENGKDRLAQQRPAFEERLARRPPAFAEGNRVSAAGWPGLPWSALREGVSEILPDVHEIVPLPLGSLRPGETWTAGDSLGLRFHAVGWESREGRDSVRLEGVAGDGSLQMRLWFCPALGVLSRIEVEASYETPPAATVREMLAFELVERARGEDVAAWLRRPETRDGALQALLESEAVPPLPLADLYALLEGGDARAQRRVLAVAYRHRLPPPPAAVLDRLRASDVPGLRALAERLATESGAAESVLGALAGAVRGPGPLPPWKCAGEADWPSRALRAQRLPHDVAGTTLRPMATPPFAGRRFVVHVPEDYRGDTPFPLIVALSGGPGRALTGALAMRDVLDDVEALVVFPEAEGYWWEEGPTSAVAALVREVLATFDVNTNRVTLTGFSNGGTGTILYASLWGHRLAAAAPMMGAGLPRVGSQPSLVNLGQLPLLFVHGDKDPVIPVDATRETVRALRKAAPGATVEEHILKGRGHDIGLGSDDGLGLPFLEGHVRAPFPTSVTLEARNPAFARNRWIEITEKEDGVAFAHGEIAADGTIRLETRKVRRLRLLLRRELIPAGPVRVVINGKPAFSGALDEDCALLLRSWRETGDPYLAYSTDLTLDVPR